MAKKQTEELNVLEETLARLNKTYGTGSIMTMETKSVGDYNVISSGSIGLDWMTLGVGGFVKGKLYELMGWEGVGKSTVCGHVAAECQKQGGKVLYIDGEHALDVNYFAQLGVSVEDLIISQPNYGEEGFNIAVEMINTGEIDLVIIDSDSSLIPKKAVDGDVGDSTIGLKARLNSNAYPKLKSILSKKKVCVIVISQYREKIGIMFGNPTTTQGGHALKFYSDCRLEISRTLAKDGDVNYGNITKFKAVKNKMFRPYLKCEFEIVFGKGIDKVEEVLSLLHEFELGKKYGKSFTYKEVKYDLEEFKQMLLEESDFFDNVRNDLVSLIKNNW